MKFISCTSQSLFTLCCLAILCMSAIAPVLASPHRLPNTPRHKRLVRPNAAKLTRVPHNTKAFKRYVIPSKQHGHVKSPAKAFKARSQSIFQHSEQQVKLSRAADQSSSISRRKDTHPLLYWTQHYNQAMGRQSKALPSHDLKKRASLNQHAQDSTERLRKRWQSIHGSDKPVKIQHKRHILSGLVRDSNILGGPVGGAIRKMKDKHHISLPMTLDKSRKTTAINKPLALADDSSSENENAAGFTQKELDIALDAKLTEANGDLGQDSVGLVIEANDVGYFAPMLIGTPPRPFNVLMDSGSADFWIPSQLCNKDQTCGNHNTLGTKSSSSFAVSDPVKSFQVTYGTGEVEGAIATDVVSIGAGGLAVQNLTFGVTTAESDEFADPDVPFDGLMGLAKGKLSNQQVPTFIERLVIDGSVAAAQIGYRLSSALDDVNESEITFGGVDTSKFKGSLIELDNVSELGFWQATLEGAQVDGKALKLESKTAILDTGTTLIVAPQNDAEALHAAIPGSSSDGQGGYIIPCTTAAVVSFTFGGVTFSMKPSDLTFVPIDINDLTGDCQSTISSGQIDNEGSWLIGDAWLKNVYFATDATSNKMGLAVIT